MTFFRFLKVVSFLLVLTLFFSSNVLAQDAGLTMQNLSTVKVDNLTDDQIRQFMAQAQKSGFTETQLEQLAMQKGMPATELAKLRERITRLGGYTGLQKTSDAKTKGNDKDKLRGFDEKELDENPSQDSTLKKSKIFGAELFNNKKLSFEPNLKMATPQGYQLGPGDELLLDIYGYSEANYQLTVSPEGSIRIPYVGPVSVSGLTIEQAKKRITSQLATVYQGIKSGQTAVNITLGNIRTIKVVILGEVKLPGTFTLPSLATAFNALYASGGPNENGSFRNIKIIRNNRVISVIDVYDFLVKGDQSKNIRLQDQDVIKVGAYETRVEFEGEVKRPGIYEVTKDESFADVLKFTGGFTNDAYRQMVKVVRNTAKERSVADVSSELYSLFTPQTGDVYTVEKVLNRFANRVQVNGAVFRPGVYALEEGITLSQLLIKAEGVREDAFMSRGVINRLKSDNTPEVLSFNVGDIINGKTSDIALKREDVVTISSKFDLKENYTYSIQGEVQNPGIYPYSENAKIADLIILAGGLRDRASLSRIEVARRLKSADSLSKTAQTAQIFQFALDKDLKDDGAAASFVLEPFDEVSIRPAPGYQTQKNVKLEGEVLYPGLYTIVKKNDRISDVIQRAGGLSPLAYANGAVLIRKKLLTETDKLLQQKRLEALEKQSTDTTASQKTVDEELEDQTNLLGINLSKILEKPGSKYDLVLEDGDVLKVPTQLQTVEVKGEVLYPILIRYDKSKGFKDYVNGAGGFSTKALKGKSYVVYANGAVASTRNFLFFRSFPSIKPGAEIYVPVREQREKLSPAAAVGISTSVVSMLALVISLFK
ncbi:SLBB domain-containing protein [Solitalea lacus]|uniref:SLBB domain-containing protein n=1 Tax=Solitalea lacus TaxID=2911172 RepID=UPI001EDAB0BC|nr:SLBB domain-containing protein [Solitalea lacus]UKJ08223.1 SLBB domain-containing protein [Solitalea lacus]